MGTPAAATDSAKAARRSAMYRRPWRRLLRAYRVTLQVVLSYWFLRMRRHFRSEEAAREFARALAGVSPDLVFKIEPMPIEHVWN